MIDPSKQGSPPSHHVVDQSAAEGIRTMMLAELMAAAKALLISTELCCHRTYCQYVCGDFASPASLTKHRLRLPFIRDILRVVIVILRMACYCLTLLSPILEVDGRFSQLTNLCHPMALMTSYQQ